MTEKSLKKHGLIPDYAGLLENIKQHIRSAQTSAIFTVNSGMILMYWDVGRVITMRQQKEGWGAGVIPRLSMDIRNDMPEIKGFSERNIKLMTQFYKEYSLLGSIGQRSVAQLERSGNQQEKDSTQQLTDTDKGQISEKVQQHVAYLGWAQNILLIQRVKDLRDRLWYMQSTLKNGWSRDVLALMINNRAHERESLEINNFDAILPAPQSDMVKQALKDPYIFDFLTLDKPFRERELELGLMEHLEKFLLELGQGFAFVGRQYHLEIGEEDYYVDLLFYHLRLRCFIVIDLKIGPFKSEYAGKMNFYCNVVDDLLKNEEDRPTIGLILCQDKKKILAEYSLRGLNKPIGVSEYELTRALPDELRSSLPSIEEIESELSERVDNKNPKK